MSRRKQTKPRHIESESEIAALLQNGKLIDKKDFVRGITSAIHRYCFGMTGDWSDYITFRILWEV